MNKMPLKQKKIKTINWSPRVSKMKAKKFLMQWISKSERLRLKNLQGSRQLKIRKLGKREKKKGWQEKLLGKQDGPNIEIGVKLKLKKTVFILKPNTGHMTCQAISWKIKMILQMIHGARMVSKDSMPGNGNKTRLQEKKKKKKRQPKKKLMQKQLQQRKKRRLMLQLKKRRNEQNYFIFVI